MLEHLALVRENADVEETRHVTLGPEGRELGSFFEYRKLDRKSRYLKQ